MSRKKARDAALAQLRKRLSNLRSALDQLLTKTDGRWYDFGFHRPVNRVKPAAAKVAAPAIAAADAAAPALAAAVADAAAPALAAAVAEAPASAPEVCTADTSLCTNSSEAATLLSALCEENAAPTLPYSEVGDSASANDEEPSVMPPCPTPSS